MFHQQDAAHLVVVIEEMRGLISIKRYEKMVRRQKTDL